MDPTTCQQFPAAVPSKQPLRCSLLTESIDWSHHSIPFSWQQDVPHRIPWIRQDPRIMKFTDVRRSRCRSASLAFKRHLESRDQEPSSKHFLSEDKMAARFNSLSLDNDHIYSSNGFPIQGEDPKWQQAYTRLKELQQRLSEDGVNEDASSTEENELNSVVVDGEFFMADYPLLTHPLHLEPREGVSLLPEEMLLSLNASTEVVLWSPPSTSLLCTIRALMATTPSLGPSIEPQQKLGATQEEMEI
ncbi:host cell factor C1 regulator 1 [Tiliqua scincoides]|uniref:host cell factor C1 regulator 1 n=1 Tax=Tiliqua scincoides TaxID=71010 RepID=UPI003463776B